MTDKVKFELETQQSKQLQHSQPIQNQFFSCTPQKLMTVTNFNDKLEKISDDEFFSQFDQMFVVNFNEQDSQNVNENVNDIQNPEMLTISNLKPQSDLNMQTSSQIEKSSSDGMLQDKEQENLIEQNLELKQSDCVAITPQKFKKQINFQDLENNQQNLQFLWAPRKKFTRTFSQSN